MPLLSFLIAWVKKLFAPRKVAHAIFDNNLFFRTAGAGSMTSTETSSALTINGTPAIGLALVIDIPKRDVGDTVQFTLEHSTNNSTWATLLTTELVASITATSTVPKKIVRRFHTRNKYVRLVGTVAGTSPDFGAVVARLDDGSQWNILSVGQNASSNPF